MEMNEMLNAENLDALTPDSLLAICEKLGFQVKPLMWNGEPTNRSIISRGETFITVVSDRYKLVPNEVAEAFGEEVAKRTGAIPFLRYSDDDGHSIINSYLMPEVVADNVSSRVGFFITNSIDERMSFRIKSFLKWDDKVIYLGSLISGVVRKHTKNIDVEMADVTAVANEAVMKAKMFAQNLESWKNIDVTTGAGIGLVEKIRISLLPNIYRPPYLLKATKRVKEEQIPKTPANLSLFGMYMDLIKCINNAPTGKLSENVKVNYFNMVHKALSDAIEGKIRG